MSKDKKKAAKPAAKPVTPEAPKVEDAKVEEVVVEDTTKIKPAQIKGMSQDSRVLYADLMQRRYIEHPANENRYSPAFLDGVNMLIDATIMSIAVDEVVAGSTSLALIIKKQPEAYNRLANMASGMGIDLPAMNLLPAPTEQQLKDAGIQEKPEDTVVVTIEKKNISKESQATVKHEQKVQETTPELDPSKISDIADMAKSAEFIMTSRKGSVFDNMMAAINFYRSWMLIQANKIEDETARKAEIEKINARTVKSLLIDLSELIGSCPFVMRGLGHYLQTITGASKSPISAFCILRNTAKNKKTGVPALDDETIAGIVSALIVWGQKQKIEQVTKDLEILKKDEKANAAAIEQANTNLAYFNSIIESVLHPDFSFAETLVEKYEQGDDQARKTVKSIIDSYYSDIDTKKVNQAQLKANLTQYAGVILNMFADGGQKSIAYSEANITELAEKEEETDEKKLSRSRIIHAGSTASG